MSLDPGDATVIGIRNDIVFDEFLPVARLAGGAPDCAVNPGPQRPGAADLRVPRRRLRHRAGDVFRQLGADPLPATLLYSCHVNISPQSPVEVNLPLINDLAFAFGALGITVPTSSQQRRRARRRHAVADQHPHG